MKRDLPAPTKMPASLSRLYARPGFLLRRAHQISAAVFEDACRELSITPAQFGVLTVLQAHPGMGQSSLARALGFDKVTVLRVLRGLQARGLVSRGPAEENRRNVCVTLTPEGAPYYASSAGVADCGLDVISVPPLAGSGRFTGTFHGTLKQKDLPGSKRVDITFDLPHP